MPAVFLTTFWEVLAWLTLAFFLVLALAVFVWAFVDIFKRRNLSGWGKVGWVCHPWQEEKPEERPDERVERTLMFVIVAPTRQCPRL